ncbi:MAG: hypothetical protein CMJ49_01035 [Planctomycetaceae bacterium]|nr:hypothetical protein [Planctomycetaceae bacterium]
MSDIGFAVVGLGMGRSRAGLVNETAGAHLVTVVDLNRDLAKETAADLGCDWTDRVDDALKNDDVDVMFVVTPSGLHADIAIASLEAGKHTITTKPMEVTVAKCDSIIAAAEKSGKLLGVDFQQRYCDESQQIKYALDNGLLGKPVLAEGRLKWYRNQEYYDAGGWRGTWKMDGGGALANQTIHAIDQIVWFMGRAKSVIGRIGTFTHKIETEDLGIALIEFESGAMGTVMGTTTFPDSRYWGVEVHGSEGGVIVMFGEDPSWAFLEEHADREGQLKRLVPHQNVVEDVVSALQHGTPLVCDAQQGRMSVELLNAIYDSAKNGGKPVDLS